MTHLLFMLLEGNDDERFFERIIKPIFQNKYIIKYYQHSQKTSKQIKNFIKSIEAMNAEYIYFSDLDYSACITSKKEKIKENLQNINEDNIVLVVKEIESWYLAGLDENAYKKLSINKKYHKKIKITDNIFKEDFNRLMPKKFQSRITFMHEILENYNMDISKTRNKSIKYFLSEKMNINVC